MEAAPVVVLFEPSDESRAMVVGRALEAMGVRCWLEGLEGRQGPTRSQALASCRAIVVLVDEAGGAYGALDAGATWKVPVFVYGRGDETSERRGLQAFCERVAAAARREPPVIKRGAISPTGWRMIAAGAAIGLVAAFGLGRTMARHVGALTVMMPTKRTPVRMTATPSNAGWMLVFHLPATPSEVWYEIGSAPGFRRTGTQPGVVDGEGAPVAKTYAAIGGDEVRGPTTVRVKYRLPDGEMQGPFEIPFDPAAQAIASTRSILDDIGPQWVAIREFNGQTLVYFSTLLVYKNVLREIRVGLDEGPLDRNVRFAPSERQGINPDTDEVFRALPPRTRSVSIELVFRDGSRSAVRTFQVRPHDRPEDAPPDDERR